MLNPCCSCCNLFDKVLDPAGQFFGREAAGRMTFAAFPFANLLGDVVMTAGSSRTWVWTKSRGWMLPRTIMVGFLVLQILRETKTINSAKCYTHHCHNAIGSDKLTDVSFLFAVKARISFGLRCPAATAKNHAVSTFEGRNLGTLLLLQAAGAASAANLFSSRSLLLYTEDGAMV